MAIVPSFVTDGDVRDLVAAALKVISADVLPPYWDVFIPQCSQQALEDIQSRLIARGFSLVQVQNWDRGAEFQRDIALYHCLVKAAALEQYDAAYVDKMDRRVELATVLVTCNGIWQAPGGGVQTSEALNTPVTTGQQRFRHGDFHLGIRF